jgi:hypothetical protein
MITDSDKNVIMKTRKKWLTEKLALDPDYTTLMSFDHIKLFYKLLTELVAN